MLSQKRPATLPALRRRGNLLVVGRRKRLQAGASDAESATLTSPRVGHYSKRNRRRSDWPPSRIEPPRSGSRGGQ
jgi:hypothetical protein